MITWDEEIIIQAEIDAVWELFSEENMSRIMPQVVAHELLTYDEATQISTYKETYREGKRDATYILTEKLMEDTEEEKGKTFEFTIAKMIYSKGSFYLTRQKDGKTLFRYTGSNQGVNFFGKLMMKLSSDKKNDQVVQGFIQLVKKEAEK